MNHLKRISALLLILTLFGCAVIKDKGSIEQDNNEYYVEIDAGGFTKKSAMLKALDRYSKEICGNDEHETLTYEVHPRSMATIPGKTCRARICSDWFVLKAIISCNSPNYAQFNMSTKNNIIKLPQDENKFKELFMGDPGLNDIQRFYGAPDLAIYEKLSRVYWVYRQNNIVIEIERSHDILLGWLTDTITIRKLVGDLNEDPNESIQL